VGPVANSETEQSVELATHRPRVTSAAAIRRRGTAAVVAAFMAWGACTAIASTGAQTETNASMRPSLLPDRLGARTALTLAFRFSGGAEGVPAPLRRLVIHLPAGLSVNLRGAGVCRPSQLRSRGASGCASKSLIGRGHALMNVHAGSLAVAENTSISVYRGPNRGAHQALEILSQGSTPLVQSTIATAILTPDGGQYGFRLTVSVPAIPTLVFEPDASFVSLSLTVGGIGRRPRAHAAAGSILVPRTCPSAGFPFAADFTFAGGATASTSATVACP
jgi:hypothetical protein